MTTRENDLPPMEEKMSNAEWLADIEEAVIRHSPDPLHEHLDENGDGDERH